MTQKIQLRRGTAADLPTGGTIEGEPRFTTDTGLLYIDDGTKNVLIGGTNNSYEVNALLTYGSGSVYTDATITSALTALGTSDKATLLLTPGTWTISDDITITSNITLKVPAGALISVASGKTLTINGPLEAGMYQVFDCVGSGKVVFSNIENVYVQWFGAVSDYSGGTGTNSHDAIEAASYATPENSTLVFTSGTGFATETGVTIKRNINLKMDVVLYYTGSSNEVCLTVGEPGLYTFHVSLEIRVWKSVQSDWSDNDCTGVLLYNCINCFIYLKNANSFTRGAVCIGSSAGFAYNQIYVGNLIDNKYNLVLTNETTGGIGWCNENVFIGGRYRANSNLTTGDRYGIWITSEDGTYTGNNNNLFIKPCFELIHTTDAHTYAGTCVWHDYSSRNKIESARVENADYFCEFSTNAVSTSFSYLYRGLSSAGKPFKNLPARGENYEYDALTGIFKVPIFSISNLAEKWVPHGAASTGIGNIQGIDILGDGLCDVLLGEDSLRIIDALLGAYVDVSVIKQLIIDSAIQQGGRLKIYCYDSSGNLLTDASPNHPYVVANGLHYQDGYLLGADWSIINFPVIFHSDVDYAFVGFTRGTSITKISGFTISYLTSYPQSLQTKSFTKTIYGQSPVSIAPQAPAWGIFQRGKQVWNENAASGAAPGWVCISRVDTAMRVQAAATDTTIEVDSTTGMLASDVIGIILDNGENHWTTIASVVDADTLTITDGIPAGRTADVDAGVYTNRWAAMANLA